MKKKNLATCATVLAATLAFGAVPASAGGLFGDGGLFRGTIGNAIDQYIEQPILTPLSQFVVVGVGATAGAVGGGIAGVPELGALLGAAAGDAVNSIAAGNH